MPVSARGADIKGTVRFLTRLPGMRCGSFLRLCGKLVE